MKFAMFSIALVIPTQVLADCPPLPPRSQAHVELMDRVAQAKTETEAREINNQLWEIWTTAPDEAAQEILHRGMGRRASYDFAGAIKDFDTLIDYCPHYAEGYNQRAFVSFIRGDYKASLADMDRALVITPDHIGALSGRALALMELGRAWEGQVALRKALELHPWLPERHRLLPLDQVEDTAPGKEL